MDTTTLTVRWKQCHVIFIREFLDNMSQERMLWLNEIQDSVTNERGYVTQTMSNKGYLWDSKMGIYFYQLN